MVPSVADIRAGCSIGQFGLLADLGDCAASTLALRQGASITAQPAVGADLGMLRSQPALQTFAAKAKLRPDRTYTPRDKAAFCRCGYDEDGIRHAELVLRRAEKGLSEREVIEALRAETQQLAYSSPLQKPKE